MAISKAAKLANISSGDALNIDATNDRVGIASTTPRTTLDVVGVVSATQYYGDGSQLSGIVAGATLSASSGTQRLVVTSLTSGTMTAAGTDGDLTYNATTDTLNVSGLSASGDVSIGGTLTYEDVTNVDSVGLVTARTGVEIGPSSGIAATLTTAGGGVFTGIITASGFSIESLTTLP